jgi:hypothetical protein
MTFRNRVLTALTVLLTAGTVAFALPAAATETKADDPTDYLPSVNIGRLSTTDTDYSVVVKKTGTYKIQYQIDYPTDVVVLNASVDGTALPPVTVVSPSQVVRYAKFAYSTHLDLSEGTHHFVLRASRIPSVVGIRADLFDAKINELK